MIPLPLRGFGGRTVWGGPESAVKYRTQEVMGLIPAAGSSREVFIRGGISNGFSLPNMSTFCGHSTNSAPPATIAEITTEYKYIHFTIAPGLRPRHMCHQRDVLRSFLPGRT